MQIRLENSVVAAGQLNLRPFQLFVFCFCGISNSDGIFGGLTKNPFREYFSRVLNETNLGRCY